MTVKEMIEKLKEFPEDMQVFIYDDEHDRWFDDLKVVQTKVYKIIHSSGLVEFHSNFFPDMYIRPPKTEQIEIVGII